MIPRVEFLALSLFSSDRSETGLFLAALLTVREFPADEGQQFTSLVIDDGEMEVDDHFDGFTYSEPAGHLLPEELRSGKKFVGGA